MSEKSKSLHVCQVFFCFANLQNKLLVVIAMLPHVGFLVLPQGRAIFEPLCEDDSLRQGQPLVVCPVTGTIWGFDVSPESISSPLLSIMTISFPA